MTVFGIAMVRDECDIIESSLTRMAQQVDHVLIADNNSIDGTYGLIAEVRQHLKNITIVSDPEPAYFQSEKMTNLADWARTMGADWVVPFDADEVWVAPGPLKDYIENTDADVIQATLYDHVATGQDPEEPDPVTRLAWRRVNPGVLPKVICRIRPGLVIEQGNHGAHYPGPVDVVPSEITIHHFPYRTAAQMCKKARNGAEAYQAAGERLSPDMGRHWRDYGRLIESGGCEAIEEVFRTWFWSYDPTTDPQLVHDGLPCL